MTPPLGSRELATYDPPPTQRNDLLPDEYRSICRPCGTVEVHRIICIDGVLGGQCERCGWTEHAAGGAAEK